MSLTVQNNKISFINSGIGGFAGIQKDFTLAMSEVAIVGIKFSVFLDDDEYFIVFIDTQGQCYMVNSMHINQENFSRIQELFQIEFNISSYGADYYESKKSTIKYPIAFAGMPLFKVDKTFTDKICILWNLLTRKNNPAWESLSESSKKILQGKLTLED